MTFTGLTRRLRGPAGLPTPGREPLIGATAERTFACPACARPLLIGQGRCPGCDSYLVAGILIRTAVFLILVGCFIGMIGGAVIAGVAMAPRLAAADAARAALPAVVPVPSMAAPAAAPSAAPVPSAVPAAAPATLPRGTAAGLLQVATTNDRLARSAAGLKALLAARGTGSAEIAPILRAIAADARTGDEAALRLAAWDPAGALAVDVAALYGAAATVAAQGLAAPLADDAAYVAAAKHMLSALKPLRVVDAATHAMAGEAGLALPAATATP
jgi:hypothetical protein